MRVAWINLIKKKKKNKIKVLQGKLAPLILLEYKVERQEPINISINPPKN